MLANAINVIKPHRPDNRFFRGAHRLARRRRQVVCQFFSSYFAGFIALVLFRFLGNRPRFGKVLHNPAQRLGLLFLSCLLLRQFVFPHLVFPHRRWLRHFFWRLLGGGLFWLWLGRRGRLGHGRFGFWLDPQLFRQHLGFRVGRFGHRFYRFWGWRFWGWRLWARRRWRRRRWALGRGLFLFCRAWLFTNGQIGFGHRLDNLHDNQRLFIGKVTLQVRQANPCQQCNADMQPYRHDK